jgi:SH3-like domain-containing protein
MGRSRLAILFVCLVLGMASRAAWPQSTSGQRSTTGQRPVQEAPAGQTPVVRPHGPLHPRKPPARAEHPAAKPPAAGKAHAEKSEAAAKAPPSAAPSTATPPPAAVIAPAPTATPPTEPNKPAAPKPNVPRFASLRFDDVNMRRGPGPRYPIEWVYKRRDLPVQIEREFDIWRLIRDPDGIRGWVSEASLTGRRSFIVTGADATIRRDPSDTSSAVAILKPGVIGRIRSCDAASDWCRVQSGDYSGYLKRTGFWGTDPGEAVTP